MMSRIRQRYGRLANPFRLTLGLIVALVADRTVLAADTPPNVVFIVTDNHGPWSLGCYGNPDIKTPNIDRLAERGTLFTRAFANNAVCSPTRATLLTGLMPSQHGVHSYLAGGGIQIGPRAYYTLKEFETLPGILVDAGYVAGLCGKWHLGDNLRPQDGMSYWVTKPTGHTTGFYNQPVIEDGKVRNESTYTTDFWTDHALRFMEQNKERPFFLYLAYNGPYALAGAMKEPIRNRFREVYADQELPSFPRTEPQPWNRNQGMIGNLAVLRKYAAEVSGVDDGVGRVVEKLEQLGLTDKTLIVFTADQGTSCGHAGYWGMGDHTRPHSLFDWTLTVPLIFTHPGVIKAGQRVDKLISNYDILPTMLSQLGLAAKLPASPKLPGRDASAFLRGEQPEWENVHFAEFQQLRGIRTDQWKYIERFHESPAVELYDVTADPDEHHNLADVPAHAAAIGSLRDRLHGFFKQYSEPKWDLWQGGWSKSEMTTDVFGPKRQLIPGAGDDESKPPAQPKMPPKTD